MMSGAAFLRRGAAALKPPLYIISMWRVRRNPGRRTLMNGAAFSRRGAAALMPPLYKVLSGRSGAIPGEER